MWNTEPLKSEMAVKLITRSDELVDIALTFEKCMLQMQLIVDVAPTFHHIIASCTHIPSCHCLLPITMLYFSHSLIPWWWWWGDEVLSGRNSFLHEGWGQWNLDYNLQVKLLAVDYNLKLLANLYELDVLWNVQGIWNVASSVCNMKCV